MQAAALAASPLLDGGRIFKLETQPWVDKMPGEGQKKQFET